MLVQIFRVLQVCCSVMVKLVQIFHVLFVTHGRFTYRWINGHTYTQTTNFLQQDSSNFATHFSIEFFKFSNFATIFFKFSNFVNYFSIIFLSFKFHQLVFLLIFSNFPCYSLFQKFPFFQIWYEKLFFPKIVSF